MKDCWHKTTAWEKKTGNGRETVGCNSSEDKDTVIEFEREHGTEGEETNRQLMDGRGIRSGTQMLATHGNKKNPDSPVGNELDLTTNTGMRLSRNRKNVYWRERRLVTDDRGNKTPGGARAGSSRSLPIEGTTWVSYYMSWTSVNIVHGVRDMNRSR